MIQEILDFLTGGTYSSLKELFTFLFEKLYIFISNLSNSFIEPLVNKIYENLPFLSDLPSQMQSVFDYSSSYINFFLDVCFISSPILLYLVMSIIFRVIIRSNSYIVKLLISWYEKLVP